MLELVSARRVLRFSSPFRRAIETQLEAGAGWPVRVYDLLGETLYDEAACQRRDRAAIAADYGDRVVLAQVEDPYPSQPGMDQLTASLAGKAGLLSLMEPRTAAFDREVLRPQLHAGADAAWITTHKGTAAPLLRRLLRREAADLENAEAVALRLPI